MKRIILNLMFVIGIINCLCSCSISDYKFKNTNPISNIVIAANNKSEKRTELNDATVILKSAYGDKSRASFLYGQSGKEYTNNTAIKVDMKKHTSPYIKYDIANGTPYQFYVISTWIKASNFSLKNHNGKGITIMVCDESDYNSGYVYSEMVKSDTSSCADNQDGWVKIMRVVKLDAQGSLSFCIQIGWEDNPAKGVVFIDNVQALPIDIVEKYNVYISADKRVRMVFTTNDILESGISSKEIQDWIDVYSEFRKSMKWLTGDIEPYEGTTDYIATETLSHYGLAGNPIYINSANISKDLSAIELNPLKDNNNILWGFVHEMSHTFDGVASKNIDMRWTFEAEFFANLKSLYSLYDNDYGIGNDLFVGKQITEHYANALPLSSGIYSNDGFMYCLMKILEHVDERNGWDTLNRTFLSFHNLAVDEVTITSSDKFLLFIQILSDESGLDIQSRFTDAEWKVLEQKFLSRND